jgi:uncharacterized protein YjiS (DUF1127 family)
MSCGNANCTSANDIETALSSFPDLGWSWKIPLSWLARMALACEQRHQRRQLLELNDQLLADIGISRQDAVQEAFKSFCVCALDLPMTSLADPKRKSARGVRTP